MTLSEFVALLNNNLKFVKVGGAVILITPQEAGYRSDPTHVEFIDFDKHSAIFRQTNLNLEKAYSFPFPRLVGRFFRHNEFVSVARKVAK
ncbi:MAG TPA: hypothetical protein VFE62_24045 [Gemmataceae bacterium]|nr:hypothetical protein [Gemmataceae bacterium]